MIGEYLVAYRPRLAPGSPEHHAQRSHLQEMAHEIATGIAEEVETVTVSGCLLEDGLPSGVCIALPDPTLCRRFVAALRAEHMPVMLLTSLEPGQQLSAFVPDTLPHTLLNIPLQENTPLVCLGLNPFYSEEDREHCILAIAKVAHYLLG